MMGVLNSSTETGTLMTLDGTSGSLIMWPVEEIREKEIKFNRELTLKEEKNNWEKQMT